MPALLAIEGEFMNAIERHATKFLSRYLGVYPKARGGITKLELVVVLGVLFLLLQLLLPALNLGREASRRQTCIQNFQRIGRALHAYHDANLKLPPASVWVSEGLDITDVIKMKPRPIEVTRENWAQLCLPYMDAGELSEQFDSTVSITAIENQAARTVDFQAMKCPSDPYNIASNNYELELSDGKTAKFSRGNYAINGGSHFIHQWPGWLSNPRANGANQSHDLETRTFEVWGNGVAGINKSFSFDDFSNGLSTLVAINEVRAGIHPMDTRGVWSLGQIGASITWAHGINGDAYGPNNQRKNSDDIRKCGELHRILGSQAIAEERMPCCDYCVKNGQATSRSTHPGGVNILLMDGAARFVSDDVDLGLWHVMHSRETPLEILEKDFEQRLEGTYSQNSSKAGKSPQEQTSKTKERSFKNSIDMEFIQVPAGNFEMGTIMIGTVGRYPKEAIPHQVQISKSYYLGIHEVTQKQYQQVVGNNPSWHAPGGEGEGEMHDQDTSKNPVENLTWYQAQEFCQKLSELSEEKAAGRTYRLPTEAEWEYGCRSGKSEPYHFYSSWESYNDSGEIGGKDWVEPPMVPWQVGTHEPNEFGLHDMRGNVFEWTSDWYGSDFYGKSPIKDPQGPAIGYLRVVRGIDWLFAGPACVYNYSMVPWMKNQFIGFRVVCEQ